MEKKERYRVLYVSNDVNLGGAALSLLDMILEIRGYVDLSVCVPGYGRLTERLSEENIDYKIIPITRDFFSIESNKHEHNKKLLNLDYASALEIVKIIREGCYNIIHTNSSVGNAGVIAAAIAGIPHVWHIRELMEEDFGARYYNRELKIKMFSYSRIITISKCVDKIFEEKYRKADACIYDGIDYGESEVSNKNNRKILLAGSITENKGQWDAVRAIEILRDRGIYDVKLYLVGNGEPRTIWIFKSYIKKKNLENQIEIHDYSSSLSSYRKKCGVALVTSRMEALGRVTVEAMHARQITVGSNTGGTVELIGNSGMRGFLYKPGDPEKLANVIEFILKLNEDELADIKERAYKYASKYFNVQNYAKSIVEEYHNAMNEDRSNERLNILLELDKHKYSFGESGCSRINPKSKAEIIENKWNLINGKGYNVADYLKEINVKKIAIYGMGHFGVRLATEIDKSDIEISYVIDKNETLLPQVIKVKTIEEDLSDVELLVVTVAAEELDIISEIKIRSKVFIKGISEILDTICNLYLVH